jgi:hypothetical protein
MDKSYFKNTFIKITDRSRFNALLGALSSIGITQPYNQKSYYNILMRQSGIQVDVAIFDDYSMTLRLMGPPPGSKELTDIGVIDMINGTGQSNLNNKFEILLSIIPDSQASDITKVRTIMGKASLTPFTISILNRLYHKYKNEPC